MMLNNPLTDEFPPDCPVLLTGASGLLGQYFCQQLAILKNFVPVSHRHRVLGFSLAQAIDLRDRRASHALLDSLQPSVIIHAAAATNVDKCENNPAEAVRTNVDMTSHLVEWIKQQTKSVTMVYISTDQLYQGPGPHHERTICPRNVYALTKCAAETIVRGCMHHLILRVNFVGWSSRGAGFVNWFVERLQCGESLTLVEDVKFSPLAVVHVVHVVLRLIGRQVAGTYNVGAAGQGWSKADFGLRLGRELNLDLSSVQIGRMAELGLRAMRPNDMTMDVSAIEAMLGFSLPTMNDTVKQLVSEARSSHPILA